MTSAAVFFTWTNASTYECMFASYQDTLYIGRNSSVYNSGGEVKGGTDYVYIFRSFLLLQEKLNP